MDRKGNNNHDDATGRFAPGDGDGDGHQGGPDEDDQDIDADAAIASGDTDRMQRVMQRLIEDDAAPTVIRRLRQAISGDKNPPPIPTGKKPPPIPKKSEAQPPGAHRVYNGR